jgi:lysophospholipase L1-like esterase
MEQASEVPLRIMPLGASITYGIASSDQNGYRNDLRNLLANDGYTVDMVGSRKHGFMKDNDVEGWPGFRIEQIQPKAEAAVPSRLPNLFIVNAGTNDCAQNFKLDGAGQRMGDLLEYLWKASPGSTIILSTLILNGNSKIEARVEQVNTQFKELAKQKASQNKRIVLVDMHASDGPLKGDLADDGTHPGDVGYNKMAKIWFRGIQEAASKGFLVNPKPIPGA